MSRRLKILLGFGIALVVAVLIPVIHHYQLRAATEVYIAQLKARGEPMDLAQVIPPPVPAQQNDASNFLNAASVLNTNWDVLESNPPPAMQAIAPAKAMIGWAQPNIHTQDGMNSWTEVANALTREKNALSVCSKFPDPLLLDFNLDYADGYNNLRMPYLASLKRTAQALSASAMLDLHQGDPALAVEKTHAMLSLVSAMQHDRLAISELVRIAIAQIASSVNWEVLQSTNLTDEQLAELQRDWMNLKFIQGDENALAMERAMAEITLTKWRNSDSQLQNIFDQLEEQFEDPQKKDTTVDKFKIKVKVLAWRYWWSYPDELRFLKGDQVLLETVRSAKTNYSLLELDRELENKMNHLLTTTNNGWGFGFENPEDVDMHSLLSDSLRGLGGLFSRVFRVEATRQVITTAIALKRYQLKHGNYPPDLKSLVPEFVSKVPLDPVDGQPLRYQLNPDGTFLLYSVGENGKDDGGNPAQPSNNSDFPDYNWNDSRALDWVWPQPATEAEIRNYYAHRPK